MSYKLLLSDVQRHLELTLLALWGKSFRILPQAELKMVPMVRAGTIYLPEFISANSETEARQLFLSSAFHACAHLLYSTPQDSAGLNNRQLVLISLLEDARVEYLTAKKFPGLRKLLHKQFTRLPSSNLQFEEIAYAVAYALINEEENSENPFVSKATRLFTQAMLEDAHNPELFRKIGLELANDIGQMRISMNEKDDFSLIDYRDDNSYLWNDYEEVAMENGTAEEVEETVSVTGMGYEEVVDARAVSTYQENAADIEGLVFSKAEDIVQTKLLNNEPIHKMFLYPEWDYKIDRWKKGWCSLDEITPLSRNATELEQRVDRYRGFVKKLQRIIQSYQSQMHRRKKQEDGVELDFDAVIDQLIEFKKGGAATESRIYIDHIKQREHELSLLVLIDLSESMNDLYEAGGPHSQSVLDLTLDSTVVLSELLDSLGHSYAIQGFNSNGRGEVSFYNFKDFDDKTDASLASLGQAKAHYSTRLGTALRHAFYKIAKRPERHKLILVITDGEPSDIDVYDPQYLIEDSAMAVKDIESSGCKTFCLSLDKDADKYVQKIFRRGHFEVVEHPGKLPQILTKLYLKVFKSFMA